MHRSQVALLSAGIALCTGTTASAQTPVVVYVDPNSPSEVSPYNSWGTARHSLQDALAYARAASPPVNEIHVSADNQYGGGSPFDLVPGTSLLGGFDGYLGSIQDHRTPNAWTGLYPGYSGSFPVNTHCMTGISGVTNSVLVEQFAFFGNAEGEGDPSGCSGGNDTGGGVYLVNATPRFYNCRFAPCFATRAGGGAYVYNESGDELTFFVRCFFEKCVAGGNGVDGLGGGLCVVRGPVAVINSELHHNNAIPSGGSGGGGYAWGNNAYIGSSCDGDTNATQYVINCFIHDGFYATEGGELYADGYDVQVGNSTFSTTSGATAGKCIYNAGTIAISNSILYGGDPSTFGASLLTLGSGSINYSEIHESSITGYGGTGNINSDPVFVFAFNAPIDETSPCKDTGNNSLILPDLANLDNNTSTTITPLDYFDKPRVMKFGGTVDMGCMEVQLACYANCDGSTGTPMLNTNDFTCFLNAYAAGDPYANCDGSTGTPTLNTNDFTCFLNAYAAGCS